MLDCRSSLSPSILAWKDYSGLFGFDLFSNRSAEVAEHRNTMKQPHKREWWAYEVVLANLVAPKSLGCLREWNAKLLTDSREMNEHC